MKGGSIKRGETFDLTELELVGRGRKEIGWMVASRVSFLS